MASSTAKKGQAEETQAEKGEEQAQEETPATPTSVEALLQDTRTKMEVELEELRGPHESFLRLEQILANFDAVTSGKTRKTNGTRAPRGSRSEEFKQIVLAAGEEGITVAEAADKMDGINPNYLYRLAKELTEAGEIRKDDKRYVAIAAPAATE